MRCAVGPQDFNLWCYAISPTVWKIENTDKANLAINPKALQVFNFDVVFAIGSRGEKFFFSATEEGALWMGQIDREGKLSIVGREVLTYSLGSALCFREGKLALTAYDLNEFLLPA